MYEYAGVVPHVASGDARTREHEVGLVILVPCVRTRSGSALGGAGAPVVC